MPSVQWERRYAVTTGRPDADQGLCTKDGTIAHDEFQLTHSKLFIDGNEAVLVRRYGFTEEELDFIINCDIKYRMGQEAADDEDEEDDS